MIQIPTYLWWMWSFGSTGCVLAVGFLLWDNLRLRRAARKPR